MIPRRLRHLTDMARGVAWVIFAQFLWPSDRTKRPEEGTLFTLYVDSFDEIPYAIDGHLLAFGLDPTAWHWTFITSRLPNAEVARGYSPIQVDVKASRS